MIIKKQELSSLIQTTWKKSYSTLSATLLNVIYPILSGFDAYCYIDTMKGGVTVKVEYSTDTVSLIVRDTGVGIPKADIVKIWERFHRVEATSRSHEGTGIGLALTKVGSLLPGSV